MVGGSVHVAAQLQNNIGRVLGGGSLGGREGELLGCEDLGGGGGGEDFGAGGHQGHLCGTFKVQHQTTFTPKLYIYEKDNDRIISFP